MKNIIKLILLLLTFQLSAQQHFEGVWQSEEDKDSILILYVEENNIKFWNYKLDEEFHIFEQVVAAEPSHIHTYYEDRVANVVKNFYYELTDKNTLERICDKTYEIVTYKKIN